jgi:hypothetical protein
MRTELLLRAVAHRRWEGVGEETIVLRATLQGLTAGLRMTRRSEKRR